MTAPPPPTSLTLATAPGPGAIAILQLHGPAVTSLLARLTGRDDWSAGLLRVARLADIDTGLVALLRTGDEAWAQIMPHGGPLIVRGVFDHLLSLGAVASPSDPPARALFPEADSDLQADALFAVSRAASPAAVDLLLAQPRRWRTWLAARNEPANRLDTEAILAASDVLDRLVTPPTVVVVGRPNVGKSTLANHILARRASVVADLPGTTRDWVAGLAQLPLDPNRLRDTLAVRWLDTPGLRDTADPIERQAIALARGVVATADVLVALRDPGTDWPDAAALPRRPDLWVVNKIDHDGPGAAPVAAMRAIDGQAPLAISALRNRSINDLRRRILERLQLRELPDVCWAFSPTLRRLIRDCDIAALCRYAGG